MPEVTTATSICCAATPSKRRRVITRSPIEAALGRLGAAPPRRRRTGVERGLGGEAARSAFRGAAIVPASRARACARRAGALIPGRDGITALANESASSKPRRAIRWSTERESHRSWRARCRRVDSSRRSGSSSPFGREGAAAAPSPGRRPPHGQSPQAAPRKHISKPVTSGASIRHDHHVSAGQCSIQKDRIARRQGAVSPPAAARVYAG